MHLKLLQKESFKKAEEATGDLIGHEIANRIIKIRKIHSKTFQRQLQMCMIKKCLKKDIYLEKKGKKLLMKYD